MSMSLSPNVTENIPTSPIEVGSSALGPIAQGSPSSHIIIHNFPHSDVYEKIENSNGYLLLRLSDPLELVSASFSHGVMPSTGPMVVSNQAATSALLPASSATQTVVSALLPAPSVTPAARRAAGSAVRGPRHVPPPAPVASAAGATSASLMARLDAMRSFGVRVVTPEPVAVVAQAPQERVPVYDVNTISALEERFSGLRIVSVAPANDAVAAAPVATTFARLAASMPSNPAPLRQAAPVAPSEPVAVDARVGTKACVHYDDITGVCPRGSACTFAHEHKPFMQKNRTMACIKNCRVCLAEQQAEQQRVAQQIAVRDVQRRMQQQSRQSQQRTVQPRDVVATTNNRFAVLATSSSSWASLVKVDVAPLVFARVQAPSTAAAAVRLLPRNMELVEELVREHELGLRKSFTSALENVTLDQLISKIVDREVAQVTVTLPVAEDKEDEKDESDDTFAQKMLKIVQGTSAQFAEKEAQNAELLAKLLAEAQQAKANETKKLISERLATLRTTCSPALIAKVSALREELNEMLDDVVDDMMNVHCTSVDRAIAALQSDFVPESWEDDTRGPFMAIERAVRQEYDQRHIRSYRKQCLGMPLFERKLAEIEAVETQIEAVAMDTFFQEYADLAYPSLHPDQISAKEYATRLMKTLVAVAEHKGVSHCETVINGQVTQACLACIKSCLGQGEKCNKSDGFLSHFEGLCWFLYEKEMPRCDKMNCDDHKEQFMHFQVARTKHGFCTNHFAYLMNKAAGRAIDPCANGCSGKTRESYDTRQADVVARMLKTSPIEDYLKMVHIVSSRIGEFHKGGRFNGWHTDMQPPEKITPEMMLQPSYIAYWIEQLYAAECNFVHSRDRDRVRAAPQISMQEFIARAWARVCKTFYTNFEGAMMGKTVNPKRVNLCGHGLNCPEKHSISLIPLLDLLIQEGGIHEVDLRRLAECLWEARGDRADFCVECSIEGSCDSKTEEECFVELQSTISEWRFKTRRSVEIIAELPYKAPAVNEANALVSWTVRKDKLDKSGVDTAFHGAEIAAKLLRLSDAAICALQEEHATLQKEIQALIAKMSHLLAESKKIHPGRLGYAHIRMVSPALAKVAVPSAVASEESESDAMMRADMAAKLKAIRAQHSWMIASNPNAETKRVVVLSTEWVAFIPTVSDEHRAIAVLAANAGWTVAKYTSTKIELLVEWAAYHMVAYPTLDGFMNWHQVMSTRWLAEEDLHEYLSFPKYLRGIKIADDVEVMGHALLPGLFAQEAKLMALHRTFMEDIRAGRVMVMHLVSKVTFLSWLQVKSPKMATIVTWMMEEATSLSLTEVEEAYENWQVLKTLEPFEDTDDSGATIVCDPLSFGAYMSGDKVGFDVVAELILTRRAHAAKMHRIVYDRLTTMAQCVNCDLLPLLANQVTAEVCSKLARELDLAHYGPPIDFEVVVPEALAAMTYNHKFNLREVYDAEIRRRRQVAKDAESEACAQAIIAEAKERAKAVVVQSIASIARPVLTVRLDMDSDDDTASVCSAAPRAAASRRPAPRRASDDTRSVAASDVSRPATRKGGKMSAAEIIAENKARQAAAAAVKKAEKMTDTRRTETHESLIVKFKADLVKLDAEIALRQREYDTLIGERTECLKAIHELRINSSGLPAKEVALQVKLLEGDRDLLDKQVAEIGTKIGLEHYIKAQKKAIEVQNEKARKNKGFVEERDAVTFDDRSLMHSRENCLKSIFRHQEAIELERLDDQKVLLESGKDVTDERLVLSAERRQHERCGRFMHARIVAPTCAGGRVPLCEALVDVEWVFREYESPFSVCRQMDIEQLTTEIGARESQCAAAALVLSDTKLQFEVLSATAVETVAPVAARYQQQLAACRSGIEEMADLRCRRAVLMLAQGPLPSTAAQNERTYRLYVSELRSLRAVVKTNKNAIANLQAYAQSVLALVPPTEEHQLMRESLQSIFANQREFLEAQLVTVTERMSACQAKMEPFNRRVSEEDSSLDGAAAAAEEKLLKKRR
jgi:hypothetical protein